MSRALAWDMEVRRLEPWRPVVRAGDQIDLAVNSSQLPTAGQPGVLVGPPQPAFQFHRTDFFMHGISFGGQLRF